MEIKREDFLDGMKIIGKAIEEKTRREVTVPLKEYEDYKNNAIKYQKLIDKLYKEMQLVLGNDKNNTDRDYLYDEIYKMYAEICNAW